MIIRRFLTKEMDIASLQVIVPQAPAGQMIHRVSISKEGSSEKTISGRKFTVENVTMKFGPTSLSHLQCQNTVF